MSAYINCPHCNRTLENKGSTCPHCGGVLRLKKGRLEEPTESSKAILKFLWLAIAFIVVLVPLGYCIRPG